MQQLSKPTYSEQVFDLVRRRIRDGELRCGDKINEAGLAEECGISRAPVREALYLLETEGFLMSHPKRGRYVTLLTPESIRHSYEVCGLLEGAAASSVAGIMTGRDWEDLEELIEKMRGITAKGDPHEELPGLSTDFHDAYLRHAENPLLVSISRRCCRVISKYLMFREWKSLFGPEEIYERHRQVYEALLTRNADHVEKAVRHHYAESGGRMAALLQGGSAGNAERKPLLRG